MTWLFIFGMIAAIVGLMKRLRDAEARIALIEDALVDQLQAASLIAEPARFQNFDRAPPESYPEPNAEPEPEATPSEASGSTMASAIPEASLAATMETGATQSEFIPPEPARAAFRFDIEDVFGRRLPIWAGGVTLAIAGVFLVRYSIERGLVTPLLRVTMAFIFGFGLLTGAEAAARFRERVADPRVAQALAGAGLATLYAAFYLAGTQYGLIGQTLAFLGLATVTAGAIALSFRFGLPSAVLGLAGGFAAPALVGGEQANVALLSLYLGLVTSGLVVSGRRQQRHWMGMAALLGGLGWGAVLLVAGGIGLGEGVALGLYLVLLGAVLPAFSDSPRFERQLRMAAALAASVQLALLVSQAGHPPLMWGLYLLLGAALAYFGWSRPGIREGNAVAGAVALVLLAQWEAAPGTVFAMVAAGLAAIFVAVPLALVWRQADRRVDGWQIAGMAAGIAAVSYATFGHVGADRAEPLLALATLALASLPASAAWLMRERADAGGFAIQLAASAALIFAALLMVTPAWIAPLAGAGVFAGLLAAVRGRPEAPLLALLRSAAFIVLFALAAHIRIEHEAARLVGAAEGAASLPGVLRWLAAAAVFASLAWRDHEAEPRRLAEASAAVLAYGALAQVLPADVLGWTAALMAIALQFGAPAWSSVRTTALALAGAWAVAPLAWWAGAGAASLAGVPVFVTALPDLHDVATRLLPILAALAVVRVPMADRLRQRVPAGALALCVALIVAHILFKQVLAIATPASFVSHGLAERTVWEALLLAAGWVAARGVTSLAPRRAAAIALAGVSLGHFALYTGLLHNPLWAAQALGPLPLVNLALGAYGVAVAAALSLRWWMPARAAPVFDGSVMVLACLAALTLLRQVFAGSLPFAVPLSQAEDLLRSLAGIVLALGFLWLGNRRGERSWRAGSLVIMLVAVAKVFLVDAAGLDGLLRVASFMALGFSLIGIGWIYARQLRGRPVPEPEG